MNIRKCNNAFTLAEVLITLMIIGILAMVTLPSIIQTWEERSTVSKVKKIYSILQQAYTMAEIEYGPPDTWQTYPYQLKNLKPYLRIIKECDATTKGCVYDDYYKHLKGIEYTNVNFGNMLQQFLLADNIGISYYWSSANCNYSNVGVVEGISACTSILVDVNGPKSPNTFGKDAFFFSLTKQGIKPWGGLSTTERPTTYNHSNCNQSSTGWGCAKWIIERSNMDYLHKDTEW